MSRSRAFVEAVVLGPDGPYVGYSHPRIKGGISTDLRLDKGPYVRRRKLSNGKTLEQWVAHVKPGVRSDLLNAIKTSEDPAIDQFVKRAAIYITRFLPNVFDAVMPIPSSKPLAKKFAQAIADRYGLPLLDAPQKMGKMANIGAAQRMDRTREMFKVEKQPRLHGTILIVDDYITTAASTVGMAEALYDFGVDEVVATALAI